jgi:D-psicose/D-tagatose/L-ribulose 3-epimerase
LQSGAAALQSVGILSPLPRPQDSAMVDPSPSTGPRASTLDRRRLLQLAGSLAASAFVPGCATARRGAAMPPIGMNMLLWTDQVEPRHFPVFEVLRAAGFAGVEIPVGQGDAAGYRRIGEAVRAAGLRCTAVTTTTPEANPVDPDPTVRARAAERMRWAIDMCDALGAEVLCGPFHSAFKTFSGRGPTADEMRWSADVMADAADHAQPQGLVLATEFLNRFECYLLNTAADTLRLVQMVDRSNFGMTYDTHHAHIEVKDPAAAIAACGPAIRHVHVSENDRGAPGSGQVRFEPTFAALHEIGYDRWLTIESFSRSSPEFAAAIHIWRDFFEDPDEVWRDGIRFIRDTWAATA